MLIQSLSRSPTPNLLITQRVVLSVYIYIYVYTYVYVCMYVIMYPACCLVKAWGGRRNCPLIQLRVVHTCLVLLYVVSFFVLLAVGAHTKIYIVFFRVPLISCDPWGTKKTENLEKWPATPLVITLVLKNNQQIHGPLHPYDQSNTLVMFWWCFMN